MVRGRRPRGLRPDEAELWSRIARSTKPLRPGSPKAADAPGTVQPPPAGPLSFPARAPFLPTVAFRPGPFRIGSVTQTVTQTAAPTAATHDLAPAIADRLRQAPVGMDARAHRRMTRGKLAVEARIDLHGMTLHQAHPALTQFVSRAHAQGRRLILVITGKGRDRDAERGGLLKRQVPHWLTTGPMRPLVLQIAEAHRAHGGSGAYYVYLRRG